MKSSAKKVELAPYDDLFSTEESRQDAKLENVVCGGYAEIVQWINENRNVIKVKLIWSALKVTVRIIKTQVCSLPFV